MTMITKKDLEKRSELLLRRLRRQYAKNRKMHNLTDEIEIDTISRLTVAIPILTKRIADEVLDFATSPPESTMSREELKEDKLRSKKINDLISYAFKCRDLSKLLLQDYADEWSEKGVHTATNQSLIEDARKALDEMNIGFELDDKICEVIECDAANKEKNN